MCITDREIHNVEVIAASEVIASRYLGAMDEYIKSAIKKGLLIARDDGWLEKVIKDGFVRCVLLNSSLVGFFVISPLKDPGFEDSVYGECCLWKTRYKEITELVHNTMLKESYKIGSHFYGCYFTTNSLAKTFYSADRGWKEMCLTKFPPSVLQKIPNDKSEFIFIEHELKF